MLIAASVLAGCGRDALEPATGEQLYVRYCASCHGMDGKGHGPVAASLRRPPPDLTQFAKEGRFDEGNLATIIDGRTVLAVHGPREMPVWGAVFEEQLEMDDAESHRTARLQTGLLVDYLRSIQEQ